MRNTVAAPQPIKEKSFSGERAYLSNMHEAPIDTGDYPCSMCETYINAVNKYMEIKESLEK
jgi:hypothetical protein